MTTQHTHAGPFWQCRQRPVAGCPRCGELAGGAAARSGWQDAQRARDKQFRSDLEAHSCQRAGCGPVCTAFQW